MTGIDCIKEYRKNRDRYLPLIDHETYQYENRTEDGDVNIGWNCGFIGDRPYFMEAWATEGITMITIFVSTERIEDYTAEEVEKMLTDVAGIYSKKEGADKASVLTMHDSNGNEFFSVNVVVGMPDEPALIDGAPIHSFMHLNELNGNVSYYAFPGNLIMKHIEDINGKRDYVFCNGKWEADYDIINSGEYGEPEPIEPEKALKIVEDQLTAYESMVE